MRHHLLTHRAFKVAACAALVVAGAAGCHDFLTGPKLSVDPNNPTAVTADQLFTGVQVATFAQLGGQFPYSVLPLYARQYTGVARQWTNYANFAGGGLTENDVDGAFKGIYGPGGLQDIRALERLSAKEGNRVLLGIAQVYEAMQIGTAADLWGDIPYSQAVVDTIAKPALDKQADVYARVQAVLDTAIANLKSGEGLGPGNTDFVYDRDYSKWAKAAATLKARFYMHTSRVGDTAAALDSAIKYAQQGISDTTGDFVVRYTGAQGEQNLFYGFLISRSGDIEPDSVLVTILKQRGDTKLLQKYFTLGSGCSTYVGSVPGKSVDCVSNFNITPETPTTLISYAENQMILAEALYRRGQPALALATLNAFRVYMGYAPVSASGVGILIAILQEKYVHLFLQLETYFDYLRTCYPNFPLPAGAKIDYVPARLRYGYSERIANSTNIEAANPGNANANFPKNATDPTGAVCLGQVGRP
ncbi:MAG TPA: SusD/RagB family nutrient-binding outer membrane lipoprotein [Gemmatimonadaceae bacterium]|nr:SusD/RagB family nutrient-binding outer membrane lipoprotein [Gemmatimonadaceae bacterium]